MENDVCFVCSGTENVVSATEIDSENIEWRTKLKFCLPELDWRMNCTLCKSCTEELDAISCFRNKCLSSYLRKRDLNNDDVQIKCKICLHDFTIRTELIQHNLNIHNSGEPYDCSLCLRSFHNKENLIEHENKHYVLQRFYCDECKTGYTNSEEFWEHTIYKHGKVEEWGFSCKDCGLNFPNEVYLKKHANYVHKENTLVEFTCYNCGAKFSEKECLIEHIRESHESHSAGNLEFVCLTCGLVFNTKKKLEIHKSSCNKKQIKDINREYYKDVGNNISNENNILNNVNNGKQLVNNISNNSYVGNFKIDVSSEIKASFSVTHNLQAERESGNTIFLKGNEGLNWKPRKLSEIRNTHHNLNENASFLNREFLNNIGNINDNCYLTYNIHEGSEDLNRSISQNNRCDVNFREENNIKKRDDFLRNETTINNGYYLNNNSNTSFMYQKLENVKNSVQIEGTSDKNESQQQIEVTNKNQTLLLDLDIQGNVGSLSIQENEVREDFKARAVNFTQEETDAQAGFEARVINFTQEENVNRQEFEDKVINIIEEGTEIQRSFEDRAINFTQEENENREGFEAKDINFTQEANENREGFEVTLEENKNQEGFEANSTLEKNENQQGFETSAINSTQGEENEAMIFKDGSNQLKEVSCPKMKTRSNGSYSTLKQLRVGKKIKTKEKNECEICGATFGARYLLTRHVRNVHATEKIHKCDECEQKFASSVYLAAHKKYHSGSRPHICSFCGKGYITTSDLYHHEKIHANKRAYKCDKCPKAFNTSSDLHKHKICVHLDRSLWKYVCSYCNRRFPLKTNLDTHVKTHTGERNYACHLCDRKCINQSVLQRHIDSHSNVCSFRCSHCGQDYKHKKSLNQHLAKVHGIGDSKVTEPVRKFFCPFCPRAYFANNKLQKHIRTHTGERPFSCKVCAKTFIDKSYVKQHMKTTHNITD